MQPRRVFVTGGTGFVGRAVIQALQANGFAVRCLVRRGSERHLQGLGAIERVEGDVTSRTVLHEGMGGCETVVHLVGIIREHPTAGTTFERVHVEGTQHVVDAAASTRVRRFLHMSALGTRAGARSRYHATKWAAEQAVRACAIPWTIFRPSVIYGRDDELVSMLAEMVRWYPIVPVIGAGQQRLQPVAVGQVAQAFARAFDLSETVGQTYDVGGPDIVTMVELLDRIAAALGQSPRMKLHLPLGLMQSAARLLHRLPRFPVTPDQLIMLQEDNVCDPAPFLTTFGLRPVPLADGLREMLG